MAIWLPLGAESAGYTVEIDGVTYRPFAINSSGQLVIVGAGSGGAIEVLQDTPDDLRAAIYGVEGSTQRQLLVDAAARVRLAAEAGSTQIFVAQETPDDLRVAIYGVEGSTQRQLLVDAAARVRLAAEAGSTQIFVAQETPDDLKVGTHGYFSGSWQRQPLARGFTREYGESLGVSGSAGTNTLTNTAVAAGAIRVVKGYSMVNLTTNYTSLVVLADVNATVLRKRMKGAQTANLSDDWDGEMYQSEGDQIDFIFLGVTSGDSLRVAVWGWEFDIDL